MRCPSRSAARRTLRFLPASFTLIMLLALVATVPGTLATGRALEQFNNAASAANANAASFGFGSNGPWGPWGFGGGPGGGRAGSQAEAGAGAVSGGGFGGFGGGSGSLASSRANAAAFANNFAPRFGLDGSGARCFADAASSSQVFGLGGGAAGSQSSADSFALGGAGLNSLAACGARASSTSSALRCRQHTVPYGGDFCDFAGSYGTSCQGLRMVNAGVGDRLEAGQTINVPPCSG